MWYICQDQRIVTRKIFVLYLEYKNIYTNSQDEASLKGWLYVPFKMHGGEGQVLRHVF